MLLTLPSDLGMLSLVRAFVAAACRLRGLDELATRAVVLAAHEAASNIVRHAHRDRPNSQFQVRCREVPNGLEVCLLDEGEPFDLEAIPRRDPAELRTGGRGLFLMRALMDELSCCPRAGRGNVLRMVKRWPVVDEGVTKSQWT